MNGKRCISGILSLALIGSIFPRFAMASPAEYSDNIALVNGVNVLSASKTAQWTANGKGDDAPSKYDLMISNYSANYSQTAYIGFEIPEDFNPEYVMNAKLKLKTIKLDNTIKANVYGADYDGFENAGEYTKTDVPSFNSTIAASITPAAVGETAECDVTDYLKSNSGNAAFRIESGKGYTGWFIGSCNNGETPPQLEIEYDNGEGAHNVPEKIDYENGSVIFDKSGDFNIGEEITLTVVPDEHYELDFLEIDGNKIDINNSDTYTFQMPSRNVTSNYIKAVFKLADYIKMRNIYEDNMMLQRDKPIYIDGICKNIGSAYAYLYKGEECIQKKSAEFNGEEWNVTFDPVSDYTSVYRIAIDGDNGKAEINNVMFGDIFLFSGQSNMWKEVSYYKNTDSDYTRENVEKHLTDKIRVMYTKGSSCYGETYPTYDAAHKDEWRDFSTYSNVSSLPAVVFSAAARLYEETGIPIGVISNAYPGSYISCWLPNTGIDPCNANRNKTFNERNWYNGRIYPIRNLKLSGIFWYQGEADSATTYHSPQYDYYEETMPMLIQCWRELFGDENLPFYYVQLCRLGNTTDVNNPDSTANGEVFIRQAQTDIMTKAKPEDNIGMAGTLDIYGRYDYPQTENDANCRNDIHPGQKRLIGERLANFALKNIYNKNIDTTGPIARSAVSRDGKIEIKYDCTGKLRIMESSQYADSVTDKKISDGEINKDILNEFEVAGNDNIWHKAQAEILDDNRISVYSSEETEPTQVRYAYSAYPDAPNLTDETGLPSYVFKLTAEKNDIAPTQSPEETEKPSDKCIMLTADYDDDGRLKAIKTDEINKSEISSQQNQSNHKVFYWSSLKDMMPIETILPTQSPSAVSGEYNFTFGSSVPAGGIQVSSDTVYGEQSDGMTYGMAGIDGALMEDDSRFDGFRYTADGVKSILKDSSAGIEADYSAYSDEVKDKIGDAEIPVRFAVKAEEGGYYKVSATVTNTSSTEETEVSLYSEIRHFILFHHKLAPGESLTKTFNVHLAPTYVSDKGGIREDDAINVCVTGRNAGLSAVSVTKLDTAKTIYTMTDSTGADQLSNVPYWMLENYGGTGQVLSKYINPEIALSNQGEGGLDAGDSLHFNNAAANIKSGDFMYVQYGFNDASPSVYKRNLEKYYSLCHEKGAKLIIVSPTERRNISANWDSINKCWTASNKSYAEAGKEFVDEKLSAGADDIAFVDVNSAFVSWMNEEENNILNRRKQLGFEDAEVNPKAMEYYFRCGWTFGTDSVHINDAGADREGYIFVQQAKKVIDENPNTVQAKILSELLENASDENPVEISDKVLGRGWSPNDSYPKPLSKSVELQYPTMIKSVNSDNGKLNSMTVKVQGTMAKYAQGIGEIIDFEGNVVKTIYTVSTSTNSSIGHIDNTASNYGDVITMYFKNSENEIPDGYTYRVYLLPIENGAEKPDKEPMYSSIYTEPSKTIDRLITSSDGNTNEMFAEIGEGESIRDKGGNSSFGTAKWVYAGSAGSVKLNKETKAGISSAHLYSNGTGTFALTKFFNSGKAISDGAVHLHFQLNHNYGWYGIKLTSSSKVSSWMDGMQVLSMEDGMLKMCDGTAAGEVKNGAWTDVDVWIDLDRCTEIVSIGGGDKMSCDIPQLNTSDKNSIKNLIPLRGFTIIYTKYPSLSPSYAFDTYISDLRLETLENNTPQISVNAAVSEECLEMGSISGMGKYNIHSDAVLRAIPNSGYNFKGWYNGNELLSTQAEFTIERICEDITLTAKFDIKRGKEETASFDISTDKTALKKGSTIALKPVNARDKNGGEIDELTSADILWSCDDKNVNIDGSGVMTVNDSFEIEENTFVEVSVKGSINGITQTKNIKVYSYEYYDEISDVSDYTDGVIEIIGGRKSALWPNERTTAEYTLSENVSLTDNTVISYKQAWSGSKLDGKTRTLSFVNSGGKEIFNISYVYHEMFSNSQKVGQLEPADTWQDVKVMINASSGSVTIVCGGSSVSQNVNKELLTDISSIKLISAAGVSGYGSRPLGICDIVITF